VEKLRARQDCGAVDVIYFNARPAATLSYTGLPSRGAKTRCLDAALKGILAFEPSVILIACNTLSVLYPDTETARAAQARVVDIVKFGVEMIFEKMVPDSNSRVLILGTPTTIDSDVHRQALIRLGIDGSRMAAQPCAWLPGEIEQAPEGGAVKNLIAGYLAEARQRFEPPAAGRLFAALCCTHFEYSLKIFQKELQRVFQREVAVLNPNARMSAGCFPGLITAARSGAGSAIRIRVFSRVRFEPNRIDAISGMLERKSPLTAAALRNYQHRPDLFDLPGNIA
ncbi:MAG: aspartate/glutamate racemase family protein, partial [Kiritimatiellae bacterium]|nr:aspartate/glutamate racemase family protein [Kiritimatiellia bacterium]